MAYAAVIGDPVDHSLSPRLHRRAYLACDLDWEYRRIRVSQEELRDLFDPWDPACRGLSVTMPHKHAVAAYLDHVDGLAKVTGAVNTVVPAGGVLAGFNTDVHGIVQAVRDVRSEPVRRGVVLGAGSTASSALAALTQLGAETLTVIARRFSGPNRASAAASRMGLSPTLVPWANTDDALANLARADLIVSTVPGHAAHDYAAAARLARTHTVLDVVYAPAPTPWQQACWRTGAQWVSGRSMLVHQAVLQIQLMTSRTVDPGLLAAELTDVDGQTS